MNVFSALFGAGVRFRNALYERKVLGAKHLAGPVVSVGNLSVGGSGKTPFVLLLGSMLKARGVKFDILSRGYGRKSKGVAVIDPAGSAAEFGDEPLLMARRLQVPVVVGEDRYQAGMEAERRFGAQLHILPRPGHCSGHARRLLRQAAARRTAARATFLFRQGECRGTRGRSLQRRISSKRKTALASA
ncbi:MAG: tetraacyldisaccharide 4'-kinase [Acidobacteria bacterium]|nr:MAG: tetraacyldisaccharide 4'-kinase [Acidobacteriota bacterium]